MWYFEQMISLGRWSPRTQSGQPTEITPSGKVKIRAAREINPLYHRLTLGQLHAIYSPDGHLQAVGREPISQPKEPADE